jgi:transcriptional regulator with XRE-family HTH domain
VLAQTLSEARRNKGWSILHLSKRSGVSRWAIERIEDGSPSYVLSEGNTALLAQVLRVPVGPLLTERDRLVERLHHRAYETANRSKGEGA